MRRRPPITPPVLWPRDTCDGSPSTCLRSQSPLAGIKPGTPLTAYTHSAPRAHLTVPVRTRQVPRLPQPRMNPGAVLQPASRLSLRRPRSPAPTPLATEPHVRLTSHERPAATRALTLLRHEPQPHATRPPAPTNIHLGPTGLAPTLPVAPRRVSPVTTLTNLQSGSIRPNPFSLLKPRGEKSKLRGSRRSIGLKRWFLRIMQFKRGGCATEALDASRTGAMRLARAHTPAREAWGPRPPGVPCCRAGGSRRLVSG